MLVSNLPKLNKIVYFRQFSSKTRQFKEVSIKVPWGHISGKWWEPYDIRPILTIHGWQDNCGSFDRLIPMLSSNVGFLAIDLPGHGFSSRIPKGLPYHFSVYQLTLRYIINYFKWTKVSLMGHSLGGVLSYSFNMFYPNDVDFTICLDGAKPMIYADKKKHMSKQYLKFPKYEEDASNPNEPPSYTREDILMKLCHPNNNSVSPESATYLMQRNTAPSKLYEGKFYFTKDPRLKVNDVVLFSQDELIEYAQYMKSPIFIAKAKRASYYEVKENFYEVLDVLKRTSSDCDFHYVDGTHHMHLNNPEHLAHLIVDFIRRNNVEDRSIGGITDEIIVNNNNVSVVL